MSDTVIAVLMGSDCELPVMDSAVETLIKLELPFEDKATSAHRTSKRYKC